MLSSDEFLVFRNLVNSGDFGTLKEELDIREKASPKQEIRVYGYATKRVDYFPLIKEKNRCDMDHDDEACNACGHEWGRHHGHNCYCCSDLRGHFPGCEA